MSDTPSDREPEHVRVFPFGEPIGVARELFQASPVADENAATGGADQLASFKVLQGERDSWPPRAEHDRHELVRHNQFIGFDAIMGHQNPARQPCLHAIARVRVSCLADLHHERVDVAQQDRAQRAL